MSQRERFALSGTVEVPGDKSIGHRACLLGAISEGVTTVTGLSSGADNESTLSCLEQLGVDVDRRSPGVVRVNGHGLKGAFASVSELDCGNSGTTMRLLAGLLCGRPGRFCLVGDASLTRRPMRRVAMPLLGLGADVRTTESGTAPLNIEGHALRGGEVKLETASAQVKSAVILAGLHADGPTTIRFDAQTRDHTERMLDYSGVPLRAGVEHGRRFCVLTPPERLLARDWVIPGDPSSAAFWIAAALLCEGSELRIRDVCVNPTRMGFVEALLAMGADIELGLVRPSCGEPVADIIVRHGPLRGFVLDPADVPRLIDELPLLALLASTAEGETLITGAQELAMKESDRLSSTAELLSTLGVAPRRLEGGWHIIGTAAEQRLRGGTVRTHGDHRIALCALVAGLVTSTPVLLDDEDAIRISYPTFRAELNRQLRANA